MIGSFRDALRAGGDAAPSGGQGRAGVAVSGRIPTLDGWRGVAILSVMVYHNREAMFGPGGLMPSAVGMAFTGPMVRGVDLFFGLSGFLICTRLLAERRETGRIDLADFYRRRAFRIFPAFLAFMGVLAMLTAAGVLNVNGGEFASTLLFYRNYLPSSASGPDWFHTFHTWSLSVEEHFYLLWPTFLCLMGTRRPGRTLAATIGIVLAVTAWRAVDSRYGLFPRLTGLAVPTLSRTDTRIDGLLLGCALALLVDRPGWWDRLARWMTGPVRFGLVLAFLVVICRPYSFRAAETMVVAMVPLLLFATATHPGALGGRILESAPMRGLGRLAYGLFLWQEFFLVHSPLQKILPLLPGAVWPASTVPLDWALTFGMAILSYRLIEAPMMRLGRSRSRRNASPAVRTAPPVALAS